MEVLLAIRDALITLIVVLVIRYFVLKHIKL